MHIDDNLPWNDHIAKISKKIASGVGALRCCRSFVYKTTYTLQSIYNVLIQPHFDYCREVLGHCGAILANKLQILQNRAARILSFSTFDSSSGPLFEQLDRKRFATQRQIQVSVMMVYKSLHGLAPNYLSSLFTRRNISYDLRDNENKLVIPLPRTNFLQKSFSEMLRQGRIQDFKRGDGWQTIFIEGW